MPARLFFAYESSPDEAWLEGVLAALRALLEPFPPSPLLPVRRWPAGVLGRDVSGVAIGVDSFEVRSLKVFFDCPKGS